MSRYKLKLHANAPHAADQIQWDFDFALAFFDSFYDRFPKYGLAPYEWDSVLDDRYSVFAVMIGGFSSPRVTVVSDARTGECFMLGLVRGASEAELRNAACDLTANVLGLHNPKRVDNPN